MYPGTFVRPVRAVVTNHLNFSPVPAASASQPTNLTPSSKSLPQLPYLTYLHSYNPNINQNPPQHLTQIYHSTFTNIPQNNSFPFLPILSNSPHPSPNKIIIFYQPPYHPHQLQIIHHPYFLTTLSFLPLHSPYHSTPSTPNTPPFPPKPPPLNLSSLPTTHSPFIHPSHLPPPTTPLPPPSLPPPPLYHTPFHLYPQHLLNQPPPPSPHPLPPPPPHSSITPPPSPLPPIYPHTPLSSQNLPLHLQPSHHPLPHNSHPSNTSPNILPPII